MHTHQSGFSFIKFLLITVLLCGALAGFFYVKIQGNRFFPISAVKIVSNYQHVSKGALKKVIASHIEKDNFLTLNINQLRKELINLPWIHDATIRRTWPGTITIKLDEQKPVALFNEKGLINQQGKVFYPPVSTIPKQLPQIIAPPSEAEMAFECYQKMTAMIQPISLKIVFLELSFDGNLKVVLNNGISLLAGRTDVFSRWKRFVSAYPKLYQESLSTHKRIGQIDLRYPNGFAVRWTRSLEIKKEKSENPSFPALIKK